MTPPNEGSKVLKAKRLVIEDAGMHTIIGVHEERDVPVVITLPINEACTEFVELGLIKVRPRFALYKPILQSPTGRFNDTFDQRQV